MRLPFTRREQVATSTERAQAMERRADEMMRELRHEAASLRSARVLARSTLIEEMRAERDDQH